MRDYSTQYVIPRDQVITSIEADEHGNARALGADEWQRRRERLEKLGGSPVLD